MRIVCTGTGTGRAGAGEGRARGRDLRILRAALLLATAASPAVALAQQEIVQPLPPEGAAQLNDALGRLARNPTDVTALLDAGESALAVGDIAAAIGFFGRANELSPNNSRVKLGLATTYVRSRRPVEALRLFAEAERAGVAPVRMAEDRALAFDLVGDSASAQELYRLAIANGAGDEARRRLALSQAIGRDRAGFEATLLPLLQRKDLAAFRTRAFGLAILGDTEEAIQIAEAMLPAQMASRIRPYLEYMPRLTQAQQAAAGTLGVFPRTASIGTDDPQIVGYAGARSAAAQVQTPAPVRAAPPSTRTAPAQTALPPSQARPARENPRPQEPRRRPERTVSRPGRSAEPPPDLSPATIRARQEEAARLAAAARSTRVGQAVAPAPPPPPPSPPPPPPPSPPAPPSAPQPVGEDTGASSPVAPPVVVARSEPPAQSGQSGQSVQPETPPVRVIATAPPLAPPPAPPPAPQPLSTATPPAQEDSPASLAEAFASFTLEPGQTARPAAGAVDITQIAIPRERPAPPPPPPPPPKHPARSWVQVATGKDRGALAFDWRRIERRAEGKLKGKGPFVAKWVQANRLLAGPFPNDKAATEFMKELRKLDIDSFTFRSAAGEPVEPLG